MIIDLPKLGPVNFDDKLTPDQFNAELERLSKKYDFEIPKSELTYGEQASRAFTRGTKQLGSTFGDIIPAMGAKALGFDEYAQKQMGEAKATQEEIDKYYAPQYKGLEDVKGISDVPGFALETIVEQIPNILTSLIPGVGLETVAARTAASGIAKNLAVQAAERGLAGEAADAFIAQGVKQSLPQVAKAAGTAQNVGIYLGSYAQNAPEIFQNIYEKTGNLEVGTSLLFGAGSAALDSVLPSQLAKSLTGPVKVGVVEKLLEKSGMDKGLLRTVTANVLKDAGFEGMTEGAQEAISIAAENFVANNPQVFNSADWNRIMESSVRGAVGGAGFGTAGGVTEHLKNRPEYKPAFDEAKSTNKPVRLPIETQGEGTFYVYPNGDIAVNKEAMKEKTKQEKVAANLARQKEQKDKTEFKEAQERLKKAIEEIAPSKPFNLVDLAKGVQTAPGASDLQKTIAQAKADTEKLTPKTTKAKAIPIAAEVAPPVSTAPVEVIPPAPKTEKIAEPVVRAKPTPVTVEQLPTTIDADTFKTLGIGPTATFIKNKLIHGKDITDPAQAAEVKAVLEAAAEKHKNKETKAKIATFLSRPEFQQFIQETPNEPIARTGEPSLQNTTVSQDVSGLGPTESNTGLNGNGVDATGLSTRQDTTGKGTVESPLGTKEAKDLASTEENTPGLLLRQEREIKRNDLQTEKTLQSQVPEGIFVSSEESKEARNILRLPALFNTAFALQDSINRPQEKAQGKAQQAREQEQLKQIEQAIAESGPDAVKFYNTLKVANPNAKATGISLANKMGQDIFSEVITKKVAEAKAREENDARAAAIKKENKAQAKNLGKAHEVTKEMTYEERVAEANQRDIETLLELADNTEDPELLAKIASKLKKLNQPVQKVELTDTEEARINEIASKITKAMESGKVETLIDTVIETENNPEIKGVLKKVKSLKLKTKTKVGKVVRKKGELGNESDAGAYDPAIDTITLDPKLGLTQHTAVHEIVHAALSHVLRDPDHPLTKKLTAIYDSVYSQIASSYGAQDIQEFAAELVGNPDFRNALKGMSAPRSGNMLQRIVQILAEFFGFRKGTNAYEAGIKAINEILDIADTVAPSSGEQMFNIITDARAAMPVLGKQAVEQTLNTFSNLKGAGWKAMGLSLMRLDHINKVWGDKLPAIQTIIDALEKRKGYQEAAIKQVKTNYSNFLKVVKANPAAVHRMEDMAYEARMAGVDPANGAFVTTSTNVAKYNQLRAIYNALPKDVREMYDTLRNDYKKAFDTYKDFLLNSTDDPTLKQKIKAQFETNSNVIAYIPFLRRGDYWVRYPDPATGEEAASAFESIRERQQFIDKNLKGIQHTAYQNLESIDYNPQTIPSASFIAQVMKGLSVKDPVTGKMTPASQQQLNNVYQAYLALFPAGSIAKNFMRSKNVPGMEKDIIRGYGDTMLKWTRKLADTIYTPQIDAAIGQLKTEAGNANDDSLTAVYKNIKSQEDFFHNPTFDKFTHGATALSYFEYISGNISSALINLTALPMLVYPILGARFGFTKAAVAMAASNKVASEWVLKGDNKNSKYKALYDFLQDHGQLEHTQARELMEGRRTATEDYVGLKAKILDGLSIPFSATEKYNRAITAIAAYDLAKENGFAEDKALRLALDTVKDVHTSGMAETAPKWMQNPIGRIFFTFKSFAWNSAFLMARAFHQAFANNPNFSAEENKAIRDIARRQLLGTMVMTSAFAGVKGMPFMGLAEVLGQMLHALFGDDDEPYDFNEDLRSFFGELIYKGPVNHITNLEISNRVGIAQDLVWRDDPRASDGFVLGAMQRAFGPAGSYLVNVENAAKMFNEGHTERAIEAVMPSVIRNGLKGTRYMVEGARTLKGDPVEEDISAYNSMMQVIGFSPASLSSKYEITSAAKGYEKKVADKRQRLLNMYDMARTGGDSDLMSEVREDINAFNSAHQGSRITGTTLQKSISARKAAEKNTINGVTFNKKLLPEIKDKFFDEED